MEAAPLGRFSETKIYASLLKVSATPEELGTPSEHVTGVPFVLIPDENIVSAKEEFRDFIYARFHGDWPSIGRIIGVINAIWAKSGPRIFVHNVGQGEYLLKVSNANTRDLLLARTCWNIAGYPMFVVPWSPEFTPEEAPITSDVVPVELRGVPYLLFNQESLSRIATTVGKPESLAPETERKENFQVANLFVCVDLTRELPSKIISGFSNGKEVEISVSYPWLPLKCSSCGKYGHLSAKCRMQNSGNGERGRRSVSPVIGIVNHRNKSRHGRDMKKSQTSCSGGGLSQKAENLGNALLDQSLEEGEIPNETYLEKSQNILSSLDKDHTNESALPTNTMSNAAAWEVRLVKNKGNSQASGREVVLHNADGMDNNALHKPALPSAVSSENGVTTSVDSRLFVPSEIEVPFLLVNRRKSGHKVAKSV